MYTSSFKKSAKIFNITNKATPKILLKNTIFIIDVFFNEIKNIASKYIKKITENTI